MSTTTHLDVALDYADRGWPVFPLAPRRKTPAFPSVHPDGDPLRQTCKGACGRDGHGLYDATTDHAQIEAWWRAMPSANIGLRTGVAFDVLDVDGVAGQEAIVAVMAADPAKRLGSGPWSVTPGKRNKCGDHLGSGDHLLYLPSGGPGRAGILPAVDWRGAGGYVVAPPSIHPDGGAYEWYEGPDTPLEPAPAWLVALVLQRAGDLHAHGAGDLHAPAGTAYGQRALESELGRVATAPEGQRNEQLNRAAYALGQLVAAEVLDRRVVAENLLTVARRIGLTEAEAVATIRSGMAKGLLSPRKVKP